MYIPVDTLTPDEPHYLLTRLLLRRPGKVHALSSIAPAYSGELGEDGVVRAARALCGDLDVPEEVMDDGPGVVSDFWTEMEPAQERPWAGIDTGLSAEEESADPELAEAIRQSLWAEGRGASEPQAQEKPLHLQHDPITALAQDETDLTLSDIITSVPADDLRRVARARKVPQTLLATRESTAKALLDVAHTQTTLSFAPRNGRPRAGGTSEHLVIAHLLPCLGGHVIRIDKSLYALIARVNLVFSRTPPTSASAPALLLPPILVASQRRHYPDYGPPTRSVIWKDRGEILTWERVVTWEAMVSEALGDNWADRRKGTAGPGSFNRGPFLSRQEGAKIVRDVWAKVWPYWKDMVAGQGGEPVLACENMGDRFKTGHALTRIVYKGVDALGSLHEFDLQCEVLRALLGQRRWRRGKRGWVLGGCADSSAWYERLALTLMTHFKGTEDQRREKLEEATQVCIDGLLDEDTHLSEYCSAHLPSLSPWPVAPPHTPREQTQPPARGAAYILRPAAHLRDAGARRPAYPAKCGAGTCPVGKEDFRDFRHRPGRLHRGGSSGSSLPPGRQERVAGAGHPGLGRGLGPGVVGGERV